MKQITLECVKQCAKNISAHFDRNLNEPGLTTISAEILGEYPWATHADLRQFEILATSDYCSFTTAKIVKCAHYFFGALQYARFPQTLIQPEHTSAESFEMRREMIKKRSESFESKHAGR